MPGRGGGTKREMVTKTKRDRWVETRKEKHIKENSTNASNRHAIPISQSSCQAKPCIPSNRRGLKEKEAKTY
jgi:hypothetical protein